MRIAIASSAKLAVPLVESLRGQCVGIITTPDKPRGRSMALQPSALAEWAANEGIPLAKYTSSEEIATFIEANTVDLVVTLSFGKIVPEALLTLPTYGWLNVHFSALPRYRGAAPVQRTLMAGESEIGVTVFQLANGMDTGPILEQVIFPIAEGETTEELLLRLSSLAPELVKNAILKLEQGMPATAQDESQATYASKLTPVEGRIDWSLPGKTLENFSRALEGNVGFFSTFRGEKIFLYATRFHPAESDVRSGTILAPTGKNDPLSVACKDGFLTFESVKVSGKKLISSQDFLRGARIENESLI